MKTTTDVQQSKEETLGKKLSLYDFFVIGFGAIIGVGWVISIGTWIDMGGGPLTVIWKCQEMCSRETPKI